MRAICTQPLKKALLGRHVSNTLHTNGQTFLRHLLPRSGPPFIRRPPSQAHAHARHAHAFPARHSLTPTTFGAPLSTYDKQGRHSIPLPPLSERALVSAWAAQIEPFLPPRLRRDNLEISEDHSSSEASLTLLVKYLLHAKQHHSKDVLAYLALEKSRWEAMLWLARVLVETSSSPGPTPLETNALSNLSWSASQSLDEMTSGPFTLDHVPIAITANEHPLSSFTVHGDGAWQLPAQSRVREALGLVWQTLGALITAAADKGTEESKIIISHVLTIIASLHHKGWVPKKTYHYNPNEDPSALQQPPLLSFLAPTMLSCLSDTVYHGDASSTEVGSEVTPDGINVSRLSLRASDSLQDLRTTHLGPEVWMEFVLWCCVHGPWLMDGVAIVGELYKRPRKLWWSLICWRDMLNSPSMTWDGHACCRTNTHGVERAGETANDLMHINEDEEEKNGTEEANEIREIRQMNTLAAEEATPGAAETGTAPVRRAVERTISTDVIVAMIDGLLLDLIRTEGTPSEVSVRTILENILILRGMLNRDEMNLGLATWDSVIARFAECPDMRIENNPRLMWAVLGMAQSHGREMDSVNAPRDAESKALATYVFSTSAAVIGLYHRTLHACIKARDIDGALRLFVRLQKLTDANKSNTLQEFFEELQATTSNPKPIRRVSKMRKETFDFQSMFPGVQYPGFFPDVPINIIADWLDLISESGPLEVGHWMIYSEDVDGPLIPEKLYGNQLIAPALVRFAATTSDASLLVKLTKAQSSFVSGRTLVALCDSRIRDGNWDGASRILRLIKDHALHSWNSYDFGLLLRPLVAYLAKPHEEDLLEKASVMLQKLLRGDLGQVWGTKVSQLDTMAGVLSSINPQVAEICAGLLRAGKVYKLDMGTRTFNLILQGATAAFGSHKGREMWNKWCQGAEQTREVCLAEGDSFEKVASTAERSTVKFGQQAPIAFSIDEPKIVFSGYISRRIETIRIIIQQALTEYRLSQDSSPLDSSPTVVEASRDAPKSEPIRQHEILDWAAHVLRFDFVLSDIDIDYELEGYLLAHNIELPKHIPYSRQSIQIYRAFSGSRKQWVLAREDMLRNFAMNDAERQMVFEDAPSAERYFLHSLAADFGLVSESFGEALERAVVVSKTPKTPVVPSRTLEEVVRRIERNAYQDSVVPP